MRVADYAAQYNVGLHRGVSGRQGFERNCDHRFTRKSRTRTYI